jgi:hypothetical protein
MIPQHFNEARSLHEKIMFTLSVMHKGSAEEIAAAIVELQGIASEEGVAETTQAVEAELQQLLNAGSVEVVKERREKKRYSLLQ